MQGGISFGGEGEGCVATLNSDFTQQLERASGLSFTHCVGPVSELWSAQSVSLSDVLTFPLRKQHVLFNIPARAIKPAVKAFRCKQVELGDDASTAVFIAPACDHFSGLSKFMATCGQYHSDSVYCTSPLPRATNPVPTQGVFDSSLGASGPTSSPLGRLNVFYCGPPGLPHMDPWTVGNVHNYTVASANRQCEVRV